MGPELLRALKFSSPEAFHTQRWAAAWMSRSSARAGCCASRAANASVTLLRMTVSSLLKSWAAAAATAQARLLLLGCSTAAGYRAGLRELVAKNAYHIEFERKVATIIVVTTS